MDEQLRKILDLYSARYRGLYTMEYDSKRRVFMITLKDSTSASTADMADAWLSKMISHMGWSIKDPAIAWTRVYREASNTKAS